MITFFFLLTTLAFFGSVATLVGATLLGTRGLVLSEREAFRVVA
ncbi:MAG TPA: hypothetical protein VFP44_15445 [Usitatibacter sp.]|nr:hypothetical protein [Usitatibacter sp.]